MNDMQEQSKGIANKLDSLVFLRGVAVLAVCFCHLGGALDGKHSWGGYKVFHDYGAFGVEVFFVISGFVIPLSLSNGNYAWTDYFTFLYKRILRLHPPYLLALALTLIIMILSYKSRHLIFPESALTIVQSLFYLHIPQDNPVFWTLIVEAQYYIFIGLFYLLLKNYPKVAITVALPVLIGISRLPIMRNDLNLFAYIIFFLIGNVSYMLFTKNGSYVLNTVGLVTLVVFSFLYYPTAAAVASLFTVFTIHLYKRPIPGHVQFFGVISYSIYLIHYPIGVKLINLLKNKINANFSFVLFIVVLCLVIFLSLLFCKIIEDPSERISRKLKYKGYRKNVDAIHTSEPSSGLAPVIQAINK